MDDLENVVGSAGPVGPLGMDREIAPRDIRKRTTRRAALAVGAVVAGLAALLLLPGFLRPSIDRDAVRIGTVTRGELAAGIEASGAAVPASETVVASPLDARVLEVLARPGALLEAGTPILRLDTSAARLDEERLAERLSRARLERERALLATADRERELAGAIESLELDLELLEHRSAQSRALRQEGLLAESALAQALVEERKARIELGQRQQGLASARRSGRVDGETRAAEIALLERERAEAARQLALATATASRRGVLTWVVREEGTAVRRGDVVARIADVGTFRIAAEAADVHAGAVRAGLAAVVAAGATRLRGRVAAVDPTIALGVLRFVVELDEPSHPALRSGLRTDVIVVTAARQGALRLPKGPGVSAGAVQELFVLDAGGGRARRRHVRLGLSGFTEHEVIDGLAPGEQVLLSDTREYAHLQEIEIEE